MLSVAEFLDRKLRKSLHKRSAHLTTADCMLNIIIIAIERRMKVVFRC